MVLRNVFLADNLWRRVEDQTVSVLHLDHSHYTSLGEALLGDCERILKSSGVIVISDIEPNAGLVSKAYERWGYPRKIASLIKDTVFTVLLFSPQTPLTLSRFPAWGLDWLDERERSLPAKINNAYISSIQSQAEEFGVKVTGFDTKSSVFKTRRFTSVIPQLVTYSPKDFRRELKTLERIAKPEGIVNSHELFPLRLARFIMGAYAGATGLVVDAGSCGAFGHAVLGSKNDCIVFGAGSGFIVDRLESLTLGSWKDWSYHEPVEDGFVFVKE